MTPRIEVHDDAETLAAQLEAAQQAQSSPARADAVAEGT